MQEVPRGRRLTGEVVCGPVRLYHRRRLPFLLPTASLSLSLTSEHGASSTKENSFFFFLPKTD
ncbi:unnamed protein product, partial [Arabidopsis halleri]